MILEMHGKGIPVELIADAVSKLEEAMAARAVSTGIPVDTSMMEKRRAWDRERKRKQAAARKSGGIPPDHSTGIPAESPCIIREKKEAIQVDVKEKKESKRDARGTRIPADFSIDDDDRKFAVALGIPLEAVEAETPQFIDYWSSVAGWRGVKINWRATWRNRMRDIAKFRAARAGGKPLTEFQRKQAETNDVRSFLRDVAVGGRSGGAPDRVLSIDHGERREGVRGGDGAGVGALPGTLSR